MPVTQDVTDYFDRRATLDLARRCIDRSVLDALQRWANDDLRSLNGQIEFVLRNALRSAGREPSSPDRPNDDTGE